MPSTRLNVTEQPLVIDLGLYRVTVELYLTHDGFRLAAEAADGDITDLAMSAYGGLCMNLLEPSGKLLVGLFDKNPGTLAHELYHACMYILDYVGVEVHVGNDEAGAYLMGYLYEKAAEHVSKVSKV